MDLRRWLAVVVGSALMASLVGGVPLGVPANAQGSVVSEGVASTNAAEVQAAGWNGEGITIAVFDSGFSGVDAAIASGNLPVAGANSLTVYYDNCADPYGSAHGTAAAEIVYDMAPAAELLFYCVDYETELDDAVDFAIAHSADIIVATRSYWGDSRGDGSGPLGDAAVANARSNGMLWISAVGDFADSHLRDRFFGDGNVWHNFMNSDAEINSVVPDLQPGETVVAYMRWADWPYSDKDYDLYLYEVAPTYQELTRSDRAQNGVQSPYEWLEYTNDTGVAKEVGVAIYDPDNEFDQFMTIDLWAYIEGDASRLTYFEPSFSIGDPATSPDAFSVGAGGVFIPGILDDSSARGPAPGTAIKPDIVGPGGVSVSTASEFPYGGTAAAAAHVAGAAALVWGADPGLTDEWVAHLLETYAIDRGVEGKDSDWGSGELYLPHPDNDDFADAEPVPTGANSTILGFTHFASDEPGEPQPVRAGCAGNTANSVWYRYEPDFDAMVTVDTIGSSDLGLDTTLAVWRGPGLGSLVEVGCDDDILGGITDSEVEFDVLGGETYWFQVGGYRGLFGDFQLNVEETRVAADLRVWMDMWDDPFHPLDELSLANWAVYVTNDGPSPTTGVVVEFELGPHFEYLGHDGAGTFDPSTGVWTIGSLAVDEEQSLSVQTVAHEGDYAVRGELMASDLWDPNSTPGNGVVEEDDHHLEEGTVAAQMDPVSDLEVEYERIGSGPIADGDAVTWELRLINKGPEDATDVEVYAERAPFAYVSHSGPGYYDVGFRKWNLAGVVAGETATLQVVTTARAGPYSLRAEVMDTDADDPDSWPANGVEAEDDQMTVEGIVLGTQPGADLSVAVARSGGALSGGDSVVWDLSVTNAGPQDATGVVASLGLGSSFVYQSHTGPGHYFIGDGTWDVGAIPAGTTAVLSVTSVAVPGPFSVRGEVVDAAVGDPDSTPGNGLEAEDDQQTVTGTAAAGSDTEAPTWPAESSLWTTAVSGGSVSIAWSPATDNVGVALYAVYLDHVLAGTSVNESFTLDGLDPGTRYHVSVEAGDAAGNWLVPQGPGLYVTTTGSGSNPFWDDDGSIFESDIEWLAAAGITAGCNPPVNDMFCPHDSVTRGQMAAFLTRALDLEIRLVDPFWDDDGVIFEADIERLAAAGITAGCNPPVNDMFCPHSYVTRAQMAAFLTRALDLEIRLVDPFWDDDGVIFEADIERLAAAGITAGCNPPVNDMFCPHSYVTRAQMAAFLHRALE